MSSAKRSSTRVAIGLAAALTAAAVPSAAAAWCSGNFHYNNGNVATYTTNGVTGNRYLNGQLQQQYNMRTQGRAYQQSCQSAAGYDAGHRATSRADRQRGANHIANTLRHGSDAQKVITGIGVLVNILGN